MIIVITESWLTIVSHDSVITIIIKFIMQICLVVYIIYMYIIYTSNKHLFNISNYSSEHILRNNKRGGGVFIFINNNIKYKFIDNLSLSVNDAYDMVTISFIY